jgi:uncharacterized membrane protein
MRIITVRHIAFARCPGTGNYKEVSMIGWLVYLCIGVVVVAFNHRKMWWWQWPIIAALWPAMIAILIVDEMIWRR